MIKTTKSSFIAAGTAGLILTAGVPANTVNGGIFGIADEACHGDSVSFHLDCKGGRHFS